MVLHSALSIQEECIRNARRRGDKLVACSGAIGALIRSSFGVRLEPESPASGFGEPKGWLAIRSDSQSRVFKFGWSCCLLCAPHILLQLQICLAAFFRAPDGLSFAIGEAASASYEGSREGCRALPIFAVSHGELRFKSNGSRATCERFLWLQLLQRVRHRRRLHSYNAWIISGKRCPPSPSARSHSSC
jgi:hypothetical protein